MPGKVNPVICEYAISVSHKVYANDLLISNLCGQGAIDLNAYLPVIGNALIESLKLLIGACQTMGENLISELKVNVEKSAENLYKNPAIATALLPAIGFNKAAELTKTMREKNCDVFEANRQHGFLAEEKIRKLLSPQNLVSLGFSVKDL
jgi:aspartate ammonia-lyase